MKVVILAALAVLLTVFGALVYHWGAGWFTVPIVFVAGVLFLAGYLALFRQSNENPANHTPSDASHEPKAPDKKEPHKDDHGGGHHGGHHGMTIGEKVVMTLCVLAVIVVGFWGFRTFIMDGGAVVIRPTGGYATHTVSGCGSQPVDAVLHPASPDDWVTIDVPFGKGPCPNLLNIPTVTGVECLKEYGGVWGQCERDFVSVRFKSVAEQPTWFRDLARQ